jgi:hypothetical protein
MSACSCAVACMSAIGPSCRIEFKINVPAIWEYLLYGSTGFAHEFMYKSAINQLQQVDGKDLFLYYYSDFIVLAC